MPAQDTSPPRRRSQIPQRQGQAEVGSTSAEGWQPPGSTSWGHLPAAHLPSRSRPWRHVRPSRVAEHPRGGRCCTPLEVGRHGHSSGWHLGRRTPATGRRYDRPHPGGRSGDEGIRHGPGLDRRRRARACATRSTAGGTWGGVPGPVAPFSATFPITPYSEPGWRDALVRTGVFREDEFDPSATRSSGSSAATAS